MLNLNVTCKAQRCCERDDLSYLFLDWQAAQRKNMLRARRTRGPNVAKAQPALPTPCPPATPQTPKKKRHVLPKMCARLEVHTAL